MNKEKRELMRITVYSDNTAQLILDGKQFRCSEIKFEFGEDKIPKLEVVKYIVDWEDNDGKTEL